MKGLLLTYLLTYGGAALALFNPFLGVCVYWLFDIVRPQYMFAWAGADGSYSQVIAIATIVGWAFKGFGNWKFGRARIVVGFFFASTLWALLSAAAAADQDVAYSFLLVEAKRVTMFTIAVTMATSAARLRTLAWVLVGGAGYVALELNRKYLEGFNEAREFGYGGMDNNSLAISMVTLLGVALFMGLYSTKVWQKVAALGAAVLIGHTILITFSRGGMLGMLTAAAAAFIVLPKRPKYLAALTAAVALGLFLSGPEVRARFMSSFAEERDGSAQSRVDLWRDCLDVMAKYPILGIGPDHFPLVATEFGWPAGKEAHSLWFQAGAERGVPGGLLLLGVYLSAMIPMIRLARSRASEPWTRYGAFIVVASLAGFIASAQFVTLEGLETPLYVVVLSVGLLRLRSHEAVAPNTAAVPVLLQTKAAHVQPRQQFPPRPIYSGRGASSVPPVRLRRG